MVIWSSRSRTVILSRMRVKLLCGGRRTSEHGLVWSRVEVCVAAVSSAMNSNNAINPYLARPICAPRIVLVTLHANCHMANVEIRRYQMIMQLTQIGREN